MKNPLYPILAAGLTAAGIWIGMTLSCNKTPENRSFPWEEGKQRSYAADLFNRGMYRQSAAEYEKLMYGSRDKSDQERANMAYRTGNIYYENLHDYSAALEKYLLVKVLSPGAGMPKELDSRIIECLERTGRILDAKQMLDEKVNLEKPFSKPAGEIVAKIGSREITLGELNSKISQMPPQLQEEYRSPGKKLGFLKQYMTQELLYESAKRKNLDKDADVILQLSQMQKSLMVSALVSREIQGKTDVTEKEIELFYDLNQQDFNDGDTIRPIGDVRGQIEEIIKKQKEEEEYMKLITSLLEGEDVTIYEHKLKNKD